mmetsp:Transcript_19926/g.43467  ORF Transcript_19926/g.43467 Transcript_19926/m.43467 type:complete len:574 (-) Transcript_19926:99-1820(-)|eukprot:CAMPEP_0170603996 /NCGR_PEP_ID=MMETSP0224-20130122/19196_1 /TAXON_ID=285029 /ORGANISM="Togula jolla, Strain CCCM 725" /LENGTH=573 /DNA_ID=CAMNT_0010928887 /DNA_START=108 /DNA_END=1829 /DNA_ORIENTATION=-
MPSLAFWYVPVVFSVLADGAPSGLPQHHGAKKLAVEARDKGINVYVAFGKAGSSTIRRVLSDRAKAKGWLTPAELGCGSKDPWRKSSNETCIYAPCRVNGRPPRCSDQPGGSVIQTRLHGYCEHLAAQGSARPCRYFTVLREPIARVLSEYAYFCRDCEENRKFCEHSKHFTSSLRKRICPDISLVEWAKRHNNEYTRTFSYAFDPDPPTREASYKKYKHRMDKYYSDAGAAFKPGEAEYEAAWQSLTSPNMQVLILEDLDEDLAALRTWIGDSESLRLPKSPVNAQKNSYNATPEEISELQRIFAPDMRLYDAVRNHSRAVLKRQKRSRKAKLLRRHEVNTSTVSMVSQPAVTATMKAAQPGPSAGCGFGDYEPCPGRQSCLEAVPWALRKPVPNLRDTAEGQSLLMVYENITSSNMGPVNLEVTALDQGEGSVLNGLGPSGLISVEKDDRIVLVFSFVEPATGRPLVLKNFSMAVMNLDGSGGASENILTAGFERSHVSGDTLLMQEPQPDGLFKFWADSTAGPNSPRNRVTFDFANSQQVMVAFASDGATGTRYFHFAGSSVLETPCKAA